MKTAILAFLAMLVPYLGNSQSVQDSLRNFTNGMADEPNRNYLNSILKKSELVYSNNLKLRNLYSLDEPFERFLPCNIFQGNYNSCTAIVTAAALSIRENYVVKCGLKKEGIANNCFSPRYFWVITKKWKLIDENKEEACSSEISFYDCFRAIDKFGAVDNDICPYPLDSLYTMCDDVNARAVVTNKDKIRYPNIEIHSVPFKQALRQGYPICISVKRDENYSTALKSAPYIWYDTGQFQINGKHALLIVDFDDKRRLFKVWNSDRKASQFLWISYNIVDYRRSIVVAYALSFDKVSANSQLQSGASIDLDSIVVLSPVTLSYSHTVVDSSMKVVDSPMISVSPPIRIDSISSAHPALDIIFVNDELEVSGDDSMSVLSNENFSGISHLNDSTIISHDTIMTWIKPNYFRLFNQFKLVVNAVNEEEQSVLFEIRDKVTDQLLQPSVILQKGEFVTFRYGQFKYKISLLSIDHAGSRFNFRNPYAAWFELVNTSGVLEEYKD